MYISKLGSLKKYNDNSSTYTMKPNSLDYMYYKCKKIVYIDNGYISDSSNITSIDYMFAESSVTNVQYDTFINLINLISAEGLFKNCVELTSINDSLFSSNTIENITRMFEGCSNLTTVSQEIFKGLPNIESVDNVFNGCPLSSGTIIDFSESPNISSALNFVDNISDVIILVPDNTITKTTFENLGYSTIVSNVFKFTVDTRATTSSNKISGIPFNMYSCNTDTKLYVDWGDGTESILDKSKYNYRDYTTSTNASTHSYETPGIYQITVTSNNWNDIRFLVNYASANGTSTNTYEITSYDRYYCLKYFKETLISLDSVLPKMYGINYYTSSSTTASLISSQNNVSGLFSNCTKLTTIYKDLFVLYSNITFFTYTFGFCKILNTVPVDLFKSNINAGNFYYTFSNCTSLTTIPTDLFKYNTKVTTFSYCFRNCTSLTSIPTDLFKYNTAVTNFSYCFYQCTSLQSIPTDLFKYNTKVTTFQSCFNGCSSIASLPTGLFQYNTVVANISYCFCNNPSITEIPDRMFENSKIGNTEYCFSGCTSLTTIGDYAFSGCTNISLSSYVFNNSPITTIGDYAFSGCTSATSFSAIFSDKSLLTTIGNYAFNNCSNVTTFQNCFYNCTNLTTIGNNIFAGCTKVTNFMGTFRNCTSLTSIPEHLFDECTSATSFGYTTTSSSYYYYGTFQGCTSLTSIPVGLFDNNTAATTFYGCFYNCSSLTSIPQDLFKYNTLVTIFQYCFGGCTSLNDFTIHIGSTKVSSCALFVTNKTGTTRTVYVPAGSTTKTSFDTVSSSLGLTIIAE